MAAPLHLPPRPTALAAQPDCLSDVFSELGARVNRESPHAGVRLSVLLSAVGRRSYGPLLLVIGLFAVSPATMLPGMTSVAAAITLIVAAQMVFGMKRPWLPRRVLEMRIPRGAFVAFLDRARPHVERVEGDLIRPRFEMLTRGPFAALVALSVVFAALITFPLSIIPFAPVLPSLAVVFFGIGLTARDGLFTGLGLGFTGAALWLAAPFLMGLFSA